MLCLPCSLPLKAERFEGAGKSIQIQTRLCLCQPEAWQGTQEAA